MVLLLAAAHWYAAGGAAASRRALSTLTTPASLLLPPLPLSLLAPPPLAACPAPLAPSTLSTCSGWPSMVLLEALLKDLFWQGWGRGEGEGGLAGVVREREW